MTNIDRAAQVILQSTACTATEVSQALADAGLLMPDLPEPDRDGRWWSENGENYDHVRLGSVYSDDDRVVISGGESPRTAVVALTRDEALELALALLAAANRAEDHTNTKENS